MISRREFATAAVAAATLVGGSGRLGRVAAQGRLSQADLLRFEPLGNVTLVHMTDLHAQLVPVHFREPSVKLGVGEMRGKPPHISGEAFRRHYGIEAGSAAAHALTHDDFAALARTYGRMGGLDRIATVLKAIRAERAGRVLLLDGGDSWTNSWTSLQTKGQDVVDCMALLQPDAMTGHWEFTLGAARVEELVGKLGFPFLAQNLRDSEFEDRVLPARRTFERGGVRIAVIGQAFPFTPIANPSWMIPKWTFGLRDVDLAKEIAAARGEGADLVVLLSHNGFDVDHKMAHEVAGIDVILSGHTHDALPEPVLVGRTLIVASGSNGKFVSRLDLDVAGKAVKAWRHRLIPVFADAITPDPEVAAAISKARAPFTRDLARVLGRTQSLLYRRGNFNGTFDDLICAAMLEQRNAEIALSPGIRWGTSLLPGEPITFEDVTNATAVTYPACYRARVTGARLKDILEEIADNIFNPDPYYQQGGDMVRTGGLSFTLDIAKPIRQRISGLTLTRTGVPLEAAKEYVVAGWASVNEDTEGPPIWDVVARHIASRKEVTVPETSAIKVVGG